MPDDNVKELLANALQNVVMFLRNHEDQNIPVQGWRILGRNAVSMVVYSEETHGTSYEMLRFGIQDLINWMSWPGHRFGLCHFTLWDGPDQIGHGSISGPLFGS